MSNGEAWTFGTTKFFEPLVASCIATMRNTPPEKRSGRTAPAIRIPLAHDFPCFFFTILDHIALFHEALVHNSSTRVASPRYLEYHNA